LEDHVFTASSATIAGGCTIGGATRVGAAVRDHLSIGGGCMIGAGCSSPSRRPSRDRALCAAMCRSGLPERLESEAADFQWFLDRRPKLLADSAAVRAVAARGEDKL
jgi:hypothetical protein